MGAAAATAQAVARREAPYQPVVSTTVLTSYLIS